MTASWDSLYLPSDEHEGVAATLRGALENLGYSLYDPFGLLPGKSYPQAIRLFVAPPAAGWVRVIGTPDPRLMTPLSATIPCLYLRLNGAEASIEVFARGDLRQPETELLPYLRVTCTAEHLRRALHDEIAAVNDEPQLFAHLPDDVRAAAGQVDSRQAQRMFDRISGNLLRKAGTDTAAATAARDLISPPDWSSPGGRRIVALAGCLTLPENWREPDFVTLRDAYQLHIRRQRKPDARLYPGDDEVMARAANALDYIPVYAGRED